MKNKLGKNAKLLISSDSIYALTSIFIDTFLVAYLLKVTNQNLTKISLYYITLFVLRGLGVFLIGKYLKQYPRKSQTVLSLGIIARALFILFIVILAEKISTYFILIAVIYAFSETLYWYAHEIIYVTITTTKNRNKFMSIKKILRQLISIFAPIILGTSIELYSFTKIAVYVFLFSVIEIILALIINYKPKHIKSKNYDYNGFLNHIKENHLDNIKKYYLASIAYGIMANSINTLIILITIMTFKTSFNLGVLTTIFAIFSIFSLMLYSKFSHSNTSKGVLKLCSILIVLGVLGLLIDINKSTLILYNFCYIVTYSIFDVIYNARKGNLLDEYKIEKFKEEYIVYTTISILIGRIIGYVLILLVSFTTNIIFFKILLAIVTIFAPIYSYLIYKSEENN